MLGSLLPQSKGKWVGCVESIYPVESPTSEKVAFVSSHPFPSFTFPSVPSHVTQDAQSCPAEPFLEESIITGELILKCEGPLYPGK